MTRASANAGVGESRAQSAVKRGLLLALAAKVGGLGALAAIANVPLHTAQRWDRDELVPTPPARLLLAFLAAQHAAPDPFPEPYDEAALNFRSVYLHELHKACGGNHSAMARACGKSRPWVLKMLSHAGLRGSMPGRQYWERLVAACNGNLSEMARRSERSRPFVRKTLARLGLLDGGNHEGPPAARAYWVELLKACGGDVDSMAKRSRQSVATVRSTLDRYGLKWHVPPEPATTAPRPGRAHSHEITDPEALLRASDPIDEDSARHRKPPTRGGSSSVPSTPSPPAGVVTKAGERVVRASRAGVVVRRRKGRAGGRSEGRSQPVLSAAVVPESAGSRRAPHAARTWCKRRRAR